MNRLYGRRIARIDDAAVSSVIAQLVAEESYDYKRWCELLPEGSLRLLRAVAREGIAKDITSAAFVARHDLRASSSVAVALERLMDGEMLCRRDDGYAVYDQLFGLWLAAQ